MSEVDPSCVIEVLQGLHGVLKHLVASTQNLIPVMGTSFFSPPDVHGGRPLFRDMRVRIGDVMRKSLLTVASRSAVRIEIPTRSEAD